MWIKGLVLGRWMVGGWGVAEGEVSMTVPDFSTTTSTHPANGDNSKYRLGIEPSVEEVLLGD